MKKFNKQFNTETTKVQLNGENFFRKVKEICDKRLFIKVEGLTCVIKREQVIKLTNKIYGFERHFSIEEKPVLSYERDVEKEQELKRLILSFGRQ